MARKSRQPAKPAFAPFLTTRSPIELIAGITNPFLPNPFLPSNVRLVHSSCADAARPSDAEIARVKAGDLVKVRFRSTGGVERMWVRVTYRDKDEFTGILDNIPFLATHLKCGDTVAFTVDEIVGIDR